MSIRVILTASNSLHIRKILVKGWMIIREFNAHLFLFCAPA